MQLNVQLPNFDKVLASIGSFGDYRDNHWRIFGPIDLTLDMARAEPERWGDSVYYTASVDVSQGGKGVNGFGTGRNIEGAVQMALVDARARLIHGIGLPVGE